MSAKSIFLATHPRACSTAFERVFMTRSDLQCIHEPFGDAFYYGPERLSSRFESDEKLRVASGFSESTYHSVIDKMDQSNVEGKRLFIKDIAHYLVPPDGKTPSIAPTLARKKRGIGTSSPSPLSNGLSEANEGRAPSPSQKKTEARNPTVIPKNILEKFHFTFLIRHPKNSIPSYFRCTIPPLDDMTGFYSFMPSESGYSELRSLFDYLRSVGQVGPRVATREEKSTANETNASLPNGTHGDLSAVEICVIDADDLLDNPAGIVEAYCNSVGLDYNPDMLKWDTAEDHAQAVKAFEKWRGFHEDAINSTELRPRIQENLSKTREEEDGDWQEKFGIEAAKVIRNTVDANVTDYEYLKQFAMRVGKRAVDWDSYH